MTRKIAELYNAFKNGILLRPDGLDNQPAWYVEAMNIMGTQLASAEARHMQELKEQ